MSEALITCSHCGKPTPDEDLSYDDELGADLCPDCEDLLVDEPTEVGEDDEEC